MVFIPTEMRGIDALQDKAGDACGGVVWTLGVRVPGAFQRCEGPETGR